VLYLNRIELELVFFGIRHELYRDGTKMDEGEAAEDESARRTEPRKHQLLYY
jgi:hypothetical protein